MNILRIFVIYLTICLCVPPNIWAESKPNILFILTDDQRWDTLGCYGNKVIRTPNLDKFAAAGARLDNFYVAAPVCCPSRANFLTGFYPHQIGVISNAHDLPEGIKTVANYLNDAGYITGFVGKAHLGGDPGKWGFKEFPVVLPGSESGHKNPQLVLSNHLQEVKGQITEIFIDSAIKFIETHQKEKWFLWLATTAPHKPTIQDSSNQYDLSKLIPPPGWPPSFEFRKEEWKRYYATITMLDEQIGRVLERLSTLGLNDETFVILASDNGLMFGSFDVKGKSVWYEGSVRVPGLVRWPAHIPAGSVNKNLFSSVDLLPTLLELAGSSIPKNIAGISMLPAFSTGKSLRTSAFSELDWKMVRQGPWKFVKKGSDFERLYNVEKDPFELTDLSGEKEYQPLISTLRSAITEWQTTTPQVGKATKIKDKKKHEDGAEKEQ